MPKAKIKKQLRGHQMVADVDGKSAVIQIPVNVERPKVGDTIDIKSDWVLKDVAVPEAEDSAEEIEARAKEAKESADKAAKDAK